MSRLIYAIAAVKVLNLTLHHFKYIQRCHDVWDFDLSWRPFLIPLLRPCVAGESAFSTHTLVPITFSSFMLSVNEANWFYTTCIDSVNYLMYFIKSRLTFIYLFRLYSCYWCYIKFL